MQKNAVIRKLIALTCAVLLLVAPVFAFSLNSTAMGNTSAPDVTYTGAELNEIFKSLVPKEGTDEAASQEQASTVFLTPRYAFTGLTDEGLNVLPETEAGFIPVQEDVSFEDTQNPDSEIVPEQAITAPDDSAPAIPGEVPAVHEELYSEPQSGDVEEENRETVSHENETALPVENPETVDYTEPVLINEEAVKADCEYAPSSEETGIESADDENADPDVPSFETADFEIQAIKWSDTAPTAEDNAVSISAGGLLLAWYSSAEDQMARAAESGTDSFLIKDKNNGLFRIEMTFVNTIYLYYCGHGSSDRPLMNPDMSHAFENMTALMDISGLKYLDASYVQDMSYMFAGDASLTDISSVSSFNTYSLTDVSYMFAGCTWLADVSAALSEKSYDLKHAEENEKYTEYTGLVFQSGQFSDADDFSTPYNPDASYEALTAEEKAFYPAPYSAWHTGTLLAEGTFNGTLVSEFPAWYYIYMGWELPAEEPVENTANEPETDKNGETDTKTAEDAAAEEESEGEYKEDTVTEIDAESQIPETQTSAEEPDENPVPEPADETREKEDEESTADTDENGTDNTPGENGNDVIPEDIAQQFADEIKFIPSQEYIDGLINNETGSYEQTSETAQTPEKEEKRGRTIYDYEDEHIYARASVTETGIIPVNAVLNVIPVYPETEGYDYDAYLGMLNNNTGEEQIFSDRNTLLYDISFLIPEQGADGSVEWRKYEPENGVVNVYIEFKADQLSECIRAQDETSVEVIHFAGDENMPVEELCLEKVDAQISLEGTENISFETEGFSIYAISYQVDMFYNIDGNEYNYGFPGGSYIPLEDIVRALIAPELYVVSTREEAIQAFMQQISTVTFSTPELLFVGKTDAPVTVGAWKEQNSLDSIYSTELTEEEIQDINSTNIPGNTWAVIGLKPFSTEESLTITSKNGEQVTIRVTDNQIYQHVITSDGQSYLVSMIYDAETLIPDDAWLDVTEILTGSEGYDGYKTCLRANGLLKDDSQSFRLFDITIRDAQGAAVQPAEGSSVSVSIELEGTLAEAHEVAHFGEQISIIDGVETNGNVISFQASSFSVYAIIDAPAPFAPDATILRNLTELQNNLNEGFYLSEKRTSSPEYATSILNSNNAFTLVNNYSSAAVWHFEPVAGQTDQFYIYTLDDYGNPKYMYNHTGNQMSLDAQNKTAFVLTQDLNNTFLIKVADENKWLQYSGSGKGLRLYTDANNKANARITLTYASSVNGPDDYYELDGKAFGIIYHNADVSGTYMSSEVQNASRLKAEKIVVRPDILSLEGLLMVSSETDITQWTFHLLEGDRYYLTTETASGTKYLASKSGKLYLSDTFVPSESTVSVKSGTGSFAGQYSLIIGGQALTQSGGVQTNGYTVASTVSQYSWMNLVIQDEDLTNDDFVIYQARKVKLSDPAEVSSGQQVIIYTRIWNENKKEYEFYAIDHNGMLVRVYERGNTIQWVGSQVNTKLWEFTEYFYEDGITPNYYYDLQNVYSGKYLAPQLTNGQVLSDSPIGINLNGRRYEDDYSTIIAWDDIAYAYAGLKANNGNIAPSLLAKAEDFYFAIVEENVEEVELTTVDTIDNDDFGITMKMIDYNNTLVGGRDSLQTNILGSGFMEDATAGLLLPILESDGYPLTDPAYTKKTQASLSALYNGSTPANHLFLKSTYNASGYFEFNSTQNYAYLEDGTNFTVYNQLGTIDAGSSLSLLHGQFLPYNSLIDPETGEPWPYSPTRVNSTTTLNGELPDSDPRKGEPMHEMPKAVVDYFFGMEMEASFTQTVSGLDAWGHDIIFEFSGDDDMWLYVDDNLVLDLGGVHSAMSGSINFRTGVITTSRGNSTLYDLFRQNYVKMNPNATNAAIQAYLDERFELNEDGQYVFKDYTTHTMKMFYMERGSGASNLHMRFNLTSIKPGTVVLSKEISGTENSDYDFAEFPYQIYYASESTAGQFVLLEEGNALHPVTYKGTSEPVKYSPYYVPAGKTQGYDSVFFLKPGQSAVIEVPDDTISYYVVECGVNDSIYDAVYVNDDEVTGVDNLHENLKDFAIGIDTVENRPQVTYNNHVSPDMIRTLTIKKILYAEDGETILSRSDDPTEFDFRLRLGTENDTTLNLAYMQEYYVKDEHGNYCEYNAGTGFVSLGETEFEDLTEEEQEAASFVSSPNGSISKIPAGYEVEIRNLLVGTRFKVEERDNEIPEGYRLLRYSRVAGTYIIEDGDTLNSGIIRENSDPVIEVHNKRGFGLTAEKEWSDEDYVYDHEPVYFAVFTGNDYNLMPGTIYQIDKDNPSHYYYFEDLITGLSFADYHVCEVLLTDPLLLTDSNRVISYTSLTRLEDGDAATFDCIETQGGTPAGYSYTIGYHPGTPEGASNILNVRTDVVTNTRRGIRFYKTTWNGAPLADAVFTLTDSLGQPMGSAQYVSDSTGLITTAYVADGTYYLTETDAPEGYTGIHSPVQILVSNGNVSLVVAPSDSAAVSLNTVDEPTIIIKNHGFQFRAVKTDSENDIMLEGVEFAVYRQVTGANGQPRKDYTPYTGYSSLISDVNGVISTDLDSLPVGTYYLVEKNELSDYDPLGYDICFTINDNGTVSAEPGTNHELTHIASGEDRIYTLTVDNVKTKKEVRIKKVNALSPFSSALEGAEFDIYRLVSGVRDETPLYSGLESNNFGFLTDGTDTSFLFELGSYEIVETTPPTDYELRSVSAVFTVSKSGIIYDEGLGTFTDDEGCLYNDQTGTYTLLVSDVPEVVFEYYDISVSKTVSGNMGNRSTDFHFVLTLTSENIGSNTITYDKGQSSGTVTLDQNGSYAFTLAHGEEITFSGIVNDAQYFVTETEANTEGYITTVSESASGSMEQGDVSIAFTNRRDIAVPTAFYGSDLTVIAIIAGGLLLLLLIFTFAKKKK